MRANYKLQRLFIDNALSAGISIDLDKLQTNYLVNVMRMKSGQPVLVFNGQDGEWQARIEIKGKRSVRLQLEMQTRNQPANPDLVFCFAPLKVGRLDYMVQKAVEMGAGVLQPVITKHTQNHRVKVEKLEANAMEAAEQCGVLSVPQCNEPIQLDEMLGSWNAERTLIFCDEDAATNNPIQKLEPLKANPLAILIGPEGGFSDDERARLNSMEFVVSIPLGPRILRADTAAVAALTIVQAVAGDW
jgi:16S rRNA (uracil1498-N3)-methyltransferase